jgi:myosin-15
MSRTEITFLTVFLEDFPLIILFKRETSQVNRDEYRALEMASLASSAWSMLSGITRFSFRISDVLTVSAFIMPFTSEEQDVIFKIISSILHLGNVYFHRKQLKHGQEGVEVGSDVEIKWAAHLLQLNVNGIINALTVKTSEMRNENLVIPLNIDQALDARDAISKALYSSLFTWLVSRLNKIISGKSSRKTVKNVISVLDIFGFEDFQENSFEQLCINYANENLQYFFNKNVFKMEQAEYAKEKIEWNPITFSDNQPIIHMLSKKPVGVFHLLDDESNFPKATDLSYLEKCHYNHALQQASWRACV